MSSSSGIASPEAQNSQSCEALENSQGKQNLLNSESSRLDASGFKKINLDKPLRLLELKSPLVGIFLSRTQAKHSPVFTIATLEGVKRIVGVTDLTRKMELVKPGDLVSIAFAGTKQTKNGYWMQLADVGTKELSNEEKSRLPDNIKYLLVI